jgi:molybdate transport system ATP-binding protein
MTTLAVRVSARIGAFVLDAAFDVPASGVTGIFGASGSGKTTLLRSIAGLHRAAGSVGIGDVRWQDDAAGRFVRPEARGIGWVSQEPDLFPHLTVEQNVAYGKHRRLAGAPLPDGTIVADKTGIRGLSGRLPASLSGGERQRVAIARALMAGPRVLLMDEPVSALDEPARRDVLACVTDVARSFGVPILYVSHSLAEVSRMADRLVWLVEGRVRHAGAVSEVVTRMDFGRWRDDDAGVVIDATIRAHDDAWATTQLDSAWGPFVVRRQRGAPGSRVRVQVRASDVSLGVAPQVDSSIMNEFAATVVECAEGGPGEMLVRLAPRGPHHGGEAILLARVMRQSAARLGVRAGAAVYARVKAAAVLG